MFEVLIISVIMTSAIFGAYHFATNRELRQRLADANEHIGVLRSELFDWQNKALIKHGSSILGAERNPPKPPDNSKAKPIVPSRGELIARTKKAEADRMRTNPISSITIEESVEKAKEIMSK